MGAPVVAGPARAVPVGRAPLPGAGVEVGIARDMARHGLALLPLVGVLGVIVGGFHGAWSAALGLVIVVANVAAAARLAHWAAGISAGALYGAALGGYAVRLGVITGFVFLVHEWVDIVALGLSIVVSQLTLLVWEVRSLAHQSAGLNPPYVREVIR